jgi:hypothetical protein
VSRAFKSLVAVSVTGIVLTAIYSTARAENRTQPSVDGTILGAKLLQRPANIFRVPKRIRSDGSVDVTAALKRFINSRPNDSAVLFAKKGRYRIDGTLEIRDKTGLWLRGRGAKLFARTKGDAFRRHVRVIRGGNIVIRDLTIKGANPNAGMADEAFDPRFEFQHGIEFDGVQGALLDHVRISDVYGDFVYLGPSQDSGVFTPSRSVTIQNSRFKRNGRMGISVDYASDVLIQDNYMGACRRSWVDVEPTGATWQVHGLTIKNNTVGPHRLNFFANAGRGDNVGDVVITNNRTTRGTGFGAITVTRGDSAVAAGGYRGPYLIEGNVGPMRAGFVFLEAADITIRNNTMPFSARPVVQLNDAHTVRVDGNSFRGATAIFDVNDPTPGLSYDYTESNNTL